MAEKAEIRVLIKLDGTVEIETHGLRGEACMSETRDLEKVLGGVKKRTKTSEYYEQADKASVKATRG